VGAPVQVGGEWLYSLVLVEAARRPFNRTQLESLSRPIGEIDTSSSREMIRITDVRSSQTSYVLLVRAKKGIVGELVVLFVRARDLIGVRNRLSQLRRMKKKFFERNDKRQ